MTRYPRPRSPWARRMPSGPMPLPGRVVEVAVDHPRHSRGPPACARSLSWSGCNTQERNLIGSSDVGLVGLINSRLRFTLSAPSTRRTHSVSRPSLTVRRAVILAIHRVVDRGLRQARRTRSCRRAGSLLNNAQHIGRTLFNINDHHQTSTAVYFRIVILGVMRNVAVD